MKILSFQTLTLLAALPAFVGCQSTQTPPDQQLPEYSTDGTVEVVQYDDGEIQLEDADLVESRSFNYIDDRRYDEFEDEDELENLSQLSILVGVREFTDDAVFGDVDGEFALGLEFAHEINNGLGFEIGAQGSLGTDGGVSGDVDVTGAAAELYGGARYWFDHGRLRPYVGAGLSTIFAGVDNDQGGQVADDQDLSLGIYAHGGIQYDLSSSVFMGLDLRTLFATDLELETISGNANYWQLGLTLGFQL